MCKDQGVYKAFKLPFSARISAVIQWSLLNITSIPSWCTIAHCTSQAVCICFSLSYISSVRIWLFNFSYFINCVIGFAVLDCWLYLHCWLLQLLWSIADDFCMFYLICRFPHADSTFRCSACTAICMHLSQCNFSSWKEDNTQNNTPLTALCPGLPSWILLKQESGWQWHQLGNMQVCTLP